MSAPPVVAGLDERLERLKAVLRSYGSVCIGYSGGVDSVFLAAVALEALGPDRVLAVTGRSASYPEVQHRTALEIVERYRLAMKPGLQRLAELMNEQRVLEPA